MWKFTGKKRPSVAIEPKPGQESVWDYPRPPICIPDHRQVVVKYGDAMIARTVNAVRVCETASPPTFYIALCDVDREMLKRASGSSFCEWKGAATYWNLEVDGREIRHVGWSYESPSKDFEMIRHCLSFYPSLVECYVDGERVRPQAGGFYGGWITDEIVGPCKGEPGTSGW